MQLCAQFVCLWCCGHSLIPSIGVIYSGITKDTYMAIYGCVGFTVSVVYIMEFPWAVSLVIRL